MLLVAALCKIPKIHISSQVHSTGLCHLSVLVGNCSLPALVGSSRTYSAARRVVPAHYNREPNPASTNLPAKACLWQSAPQDRSGRHFRSGFAEVRRSAYVICPTSPAPRMYWQTYVMQNRSIPRIATYRKCLVCSSVTRHHFTRNQSPISGTTFVLIALDFY